jgi:lipopolysaccharide exporter
VERPAKHVQRSAMSQALRVLVSGSMLSQGLAVLSIPLVTRIYTPTEVGTFAAAWTLATVLSVTANLRYEMVIPGIEEERSAALVLVLCGALTVPMIIVGSGLAAIAIQLDVLGFGVLPLWSAVVIGVVAGVIGAASAVRFWMIRHAKFAEISAMMVRQGLVRLLVTLGGGLAVPGWGGLLAGEVGGRVAGALSPWRAAVASLAGTGRAAIIREFLRLARLYRRAPLILLPSTLLDTVAAALLVPLVLTLHGPEGAGMVIMVQRVLSGPSALVGASVGDALHGIAAQDLRTQPDRLRILFRRTTARLAALGLITILPLALLAPWAAGALLGDEWAAAGPIASAIAPWAFAGLVVSPVSRLLIVLHRESWKLYYDVAALLLLVTGMLVSARLDLTLPVAMAIVSLLQVGAYGVYVGLLNAAIRRPGARPTDAIALAISAEGEAVE